MGTHSIVAAHFGDEIKGVYVHWDGYPDGRLPVLKELIERDGVQKVIDTIIGEPNGWSSLSAHDSSLGIGMTDGRFLSIPGYGVQYAPHPIQGSKDHWTPDEHTADEVSIEYIYIIEPDGSIKWAESMQVDFKDLKWNHVTMEASA